MNDRIKRLKQRAQAGFTLIELLVVITILGILAAIVVFSVSGINDRGQNSACKTDTTTIRTGMEAFYAKNNTYPAASVGATSLVPTFLSTASSMHGTTGGGAAYNISEQLGTGPNTTLGTSGQCGNTGDTVGQNTTDL